MGNSLNAGLRKKLRKGAATLIAGASNALMAQIAKNAGFEALSVPGSGVTNCFLGAPDMGLVTLTEMAQHVAAIRENVEIPLLIDVDTGFGGVLNVQRTVKVLERAGASAVVLEDQHFPKRGGLFGDNPIISAQAMADKIAAAADARDDGDFLIIARTDAIRVEGIDAALDRAKLYIDSGADLTFIVNPRDREMMKKIMTLPVPQMVNIIVGGVTPMLPRQEFADLGFAAVLYGNAALQAAMVTMKIVFEHLSKNGTLDGLPVPMADFKVRQEMVHKEKFDEAEARFSKAAKEGK